MDRSLIEKNINNILKETNFPELGEKKAGKVRDSYFREDKVIIIATDRHSSFDRVIAHIPFKGQVLTQTSLFWFQQTQDIIANHLLFSPDPNVIVAKRCQVIPIEMIVRGFITGVTETSLWTRYQKGERDFGFFSLPDGMRKNQRLTEPVLTPTTKFEKHDRNLKPQDLEEFIDWDIWEKIKDYSLQLFKRGQEVALRQGLILVDTKYEFGFDKEDNILLIDEIHTPDSSRWWKAETYDQRFTEGEEPEYFDKEFLRMWFKENCDPYNDEKLPEAPKDMIVELASRYITICEQITGKKFEVAENPIIARIKDSLQREGYSIE